MSDVRVPDNCVTVTIKSVTGGTLNQELILREYSDEVAIHVMKNFAVTDGISAAFKELAKASGAQL